MIDKLQDDPWSRYLDCISRKPPTGLKMDFILAESAVSKACRRISVKIKQAKKLENQIYRSENKLKLSKRILWAK